MQQSGFWNVHSECDKKRSWGLFASQDTTISLIQQQASYDLILKYPPQPFKQNSTGQLLFFAQTNTGNQYVTYQHPNHSFQKQQPLVYKSMDALMQHLNLRRASVCKQLETIKTSRYCLMLPLFFSPPGLHSCSDPLKLTFLEALSSV